MALSLFTKRSRKPSKRLLAIAGYLHLTAFLAGALSIPLIIAGYFVPNLGMKLPWSFPETLAITASATLSLFLIGRGLERRQRWAGYLALFTFGTPLVRHFLNPLPGAPVQILPLVALITVLSVWRELGTVRDSDFESIGDDDDQLPKRNRGFSEPRSLPPEAMSDVDQRNRKRTQDIRSR